MTSTQLEPPSEDQLYSAHTTVEEGQESHISENRDISQIDTM
jgi:hypothetical protein